MAGEHFVEQHRSWSEVPSGLVGYDVRKENLLCTISNTCSISAKERTSVGMLALAVAGLASLCRFLFRARDGSASREAAVLAL